MVVRAPLVPAVQFGSLTEQSEGVGVGQSKADPTGPPVGVLAGSLWIRKNLKKFCGWYDSNVRDLYLRFSLPAENGPDPNLESGTTCGGRSEPRIGVP